MTRAIDRQAVDDLIGALPPDCQIEILKEALGRAADSLEANGIQLTSPDLLDALQMQALLVQESRDHLEGLASDRIPEESPAPRLAAIVVALDNGFSVLPDWDIIPIPADLDIVNNQIQVLEDFQAPDLDALTQICLNLGLCDTLLVKGYLLSTKKNTRVEGISILDRSFYLFEQCFRIAGADVEALRAISSDLDDRTANYKAFRLGTPLVVAHGHYVSRFRFIERMKIKSFPKKTPRCDSYRSARVSNRRLINLFFQHYGDQLPESD